MKNIFIIIVILISMGYMVNILLDKYENAKVISEKNMKNLPSNNK